MAYRGALRLPLPAPRAGPLGA
jgi:hypothetical protein